MYSTNRGSNNALSNRFMITTDSFGNIGGPTPTTPTLTPTTLKNIEESFMELSGIPPAPLEHQHQAGFVPPLVNISSTYAAMQTANHNNNNNGDQNNNSEMDYASDDINDTDDSSSQSTTWVDFTTKSDNSLDSISFHGNGKDAKNVRRATSGRKPRNDKLTPEEEHKRVQRRERNKQAAARCRKRRLDHTNSLLRETDGLEEKKLALQNEIEQLKSQKEELEYILQTHKANCKLTQKVGNMDIKPNVCNGSVITVATNLSTKSRPNSLPISCVYASNNHENNNNNHYKNETISEAGIPIQTPSNGLFFDSILEGGTGLTPIHLNGSFTPSCMALTPSTASCIASTTCGSQQRSSTTPSREISTPDSVKLVPL